DLQLDRGLSRFELRPGVGVRCVTRRIGEHAQQLGTSGSGEYEKVPGPIERREVRKGQTLGPDQAVEKPTRWRSGSFDPQQSVRASIAGWCAVLMPSEHRGRIGR